MGDVLKGRGCAWEFEDGGLRITPEPGKKGSKLSMELGARFVPYDALAEVALEADARGRVVLRVVPRQGADPVMSAAAGQLQDSLDPYRLVLPAAKETLAAQYADEMRAAFVERGPAERFLIAGPSVPRSFQAWDGEAAFDGQAVTFTWFSSTASPTKYAAGDRRYPITEIEGVDWHALEDARGSLRLRVRGHQALSNPNNDPASVVFGIGWGATHHSLPFAAAVLDAVQATKAEPLTRR
ncbi:DUF4429 domain-containing protein [Nonomuraea glycinis]|uniref:DUF4429 domain-containing protein n=1 Tax=Nonomuraea glycinis TaxID=2047744 RepID=A0A918A6Q6_9ACTN|nr:DUF4429 domain-containing protein [Nonomuraea glycinis]MCA2177694.1 DUF4429 domain-containing protein [Nonomuraea glycinis]GGP06807.1 hypothetical protein GCM10012278_32320 [Nonomuraea glycinis]